MSDNACYCYCGKRWGSCAQPSQCLRDLRAREAGKRPSALAPRRVPKVSLAHLAAAFEAAKEEP